ncbi:hypothetical protein CQA18_25980, partial [Enterobacter hormaechei]
IDRAAVRELIAVGVHHLVVVDGAMRMHRGDRRAGQVVIVADADKRQQLVTSVDPSLQAGLIEQQ